MSGTRDYTFRLRAVLTLLAFALGYGECAADQVLERILDDWQTRQDRIDRIKYVAEGTTLFPRGSMNIVGGTDLPEAAEKQYPASDYTCEVSLILYLDFDRNLARKEKRGQTFSVAKMGFQPETRIALFDGKQLQRYRPRDENELDRYSIELYKHTESFSDVFFETADYPPFFGHAVFANKTHTVAPTTGLRIPIQRDMYHVQGRVVQNGEERVVLRTGALGDRTYYEYWVNVEDESAVTHWELVSGDRPVNVLDVEYQDTPHGPLPVRWKYVWEWGDGRIVRVDEYEVKDVSINLDLPRTLFAIVPTDGMTVFDIAADREYIEGQPGSDLRILRQGATRGIFWFVILAGVGAICCVVAVLFWLHKRGVWKGTTL